MNDHKIDLSLYTPGDPSTQGIIIRCTGGTTGTPKLVLRKREAGFEKVKLGARIRIVNTYTQYPMHNQRFLRSGYDIDRMLFLNTDDLKHKDFAHILNEYKPTHIHTLQSLFKKMLDSIGVSKASKLLNRLSNIELSGEFASSSFLKEIKDHFNDVKVSINYSTAEVGYVGKSCPDILNFHYDKDTIHTPIHPQDDCEIEIRNKDEDGKGEIIVRRFGREFLTGDSGRLIDKPCQCGKKQTLLVYGRRNFDVVYCAGATILSSMIKRVFSNFEEHVRDYFIEVREKTHEGKTVGHLTFILVPTDRLRSKENSESYIIQEIESALPLTNTRMLSDLIRDDIFLPSTIKLVDVIPRGDKKIYLRKVA